MKCDVCVQYFMLIHRMAPPYPFLFGAVINQFCVLAGTQTATIN